MQKHTQNEKRENDKLSFFHRTINLANRHLNTLTCTQWITRSSTTKNIRQLFIIAFDTKWVHFYSETNKKQTKKVVILFSLFYFIALLFINFSPWLNRIRIIVDRPFAPFERLKIDNKKKIDYILNGVTWMHVRFSLFQPTNASWFTPCCTHVRQHST